MSVRKANDAYECLISLLVYLQIYRELGITQMQEPWRVHKWALIALWSWLSNKSILICVEFACFTAQTIEQIARYEFLSVQISSDRVMWRMKIKLKR